MTDLLKDDAGNIVWETGDPLIDEWEQALAHGVEPDLYKDLPANVLNRLGIDPEDQCSFTQGILAQHAGIAPDPRSQQVRDIIQRIEKHNG